MPVEHPVYGLTPTVEEVTEYLNDQALTIFPHLKREDLAKYSCEAHWDEAKNKYFIRKMTLKETGQVVYTSDKSN